MSSTVFDCFGPDGEGMKLIFEGVSHITIDKYLKVRHINTDRYQNRYIEASKKGCILFARQETTPTKTMEECLDYLKKLAKSEKEWIDREKKQIDLKIKETEDFIKSNSESIINRTNRVKRTEKLIARFYNE